MEITSLLTYLLKSSIAFITLYGLYLLLFRKGQQFMIGRFYLVFTIVFASLFPFINFISYKTVEIPALETSNTAITNANQNIVNNVSALSFWNQVNLNNIALYLYLCVSSLILFRLLYLLIRFGINLLKHSRIERLYGQKVIVSDCWDQTFSFFGIIVLPERDFLLKENQLLIVHELVHVRQYHSLDLLLAELFQVIHWFNPLAYLIKQDMHEIHEFLADFSVVKTGVNKSTYQLLLLNYLANSVTPRVTNTFSAKLLKKRFAMMTTNKTPKSALIKYLLTIPVIAVLIGLMSFQTKVNYVIQTSSEPSETQVKESAQNYNLNFAASESLKEMEKETKSGNNLSENTTVQESLNKKLLAIIQNHKVTFLKDFQMSSEDVLMILKQGITYRFYMVRSKDDKGIKNEMVLSKENKEKATETIAPIKIYNDEEYSYVDYSCKNTGTYKLRITNFASDNNYVVGLCLLSINEASKTDTIKSAQTKIDKTNEPYTVVEEMPKFNYQGLDYNNYIIKNLKYPDEAAKKEIQGTVYISFIIEANGQVTNVKIVRGVDPLLDNEAKRVIETMPNWTSGRQKGKNVRVQQTVPIAFHL